jgi:hypothetical protein
MPKARCDWVVVAGGVTAMGDDRSRTRRGGRTQVAPTTVLGAAWGPGQRFCGWDFETP